MKALRGVLCLFQLINFGMRQPRRNGELQLDLSAAARPRDRELAPLAMQLLFDPVRQLVYGAKSRARHVLVAGEPVVVDGEITSFDDAALQAELRQIRKKFMPSN